MKTESAGKDTGRGREKQRTKQPLGANENARKNENNVGPKEARLIGIIKCHKRRKRGQSSYAAV